MSIAVSSDPTPTPYSPHLPRPAGGCPSPVITWHDRLETTAYHALTPVARIATVGVGTGLFSFFAGVNKVLRLGWTVADAVMPPPRILAPARLAYGLGHDAIILSRCLLGVAVGVSMAAASPLMAPVGIATGLRSPTRERLANFNIDTHTAEHFASELAYAIIGEIY